ncbi:MAG: xanthine dehydrogenase family protein subunit M [Desulfobacteraceae bacterium]|jgi:xanthine dehydrogenase FAD-binding subunit|nr:MAG: xanthine dehydrogenase family protein subunit M [Desulfobacteraceae bacterium]
MKPVFLPRSKEELWDLLSRYPDAMVYAGGTDLLVRLRKGILDPKVLVCLERIDSLKSVEDQGDRFFVGACATHARLLAEPVIGRLYPVLFQALSQLGSPHIRNMGTIGGNIVTASPAGDTLPPLYVLSARVLISGREESREVPIKDFIIGPGRTGLRSGEIIEGVRIEKMQPYNLAVFEKIGQRKALSISIVSLAALLKISESGIVEKARFAWGSVGPTIVVSPEAESFLVGKRLEEGYLKEAATFARRAASPIDDVRASASYRRLVAGNLLFRLEGHLKENHLKAEQPDLPWKDQA